MFLKLLCAILCLTISAIVCDQDLVTDFEKLGNLTIKYGQSTEIRFRIKDNSYGSLLSQLETFKSEQNIKFEELSAKIDRIVAPVVDTTSYPHSCADATAKSRLSGIYQILLPEYSAQPFLVRCDEYTHGGGWTTVLHRYDGSVKFYRFWNDYKHGFGNVNGEHFIGLSKLHLLTKGLDQEIIFVMVNHKGEEKYAKYDSFAIGSERELFKLHRLGDYSGTAGDSFSGQKTYSFTSRDRDNDIYQGNCAELYTGGWWYNKCHGCNLMGIYNETTYGKGVTWDSFMGQNESLKSVKMMIRYRR